MKREKKREKKEIGEIPRFRECTFSFLVEPWRSKTGLLLLSHRAICKNSQSKGS
jgi:hypothetical protein